MELKTTRFNEEENERLIYCTGSIDLYTNIDYSKGFTEEVVKQIDKALDKTMETSKYNFYFGTFKDLMDFYKIETDGMKDPDRKTLFMQVGDNIKREEVIIFILMRLREKLDNIMDDNKIGEKIKWEEHCN